MSRGLTTVVSSALLLAGLLVGYYGAKSLYEPYIPPVLDPGIRQSRLGYFLYDRQRVSQGTRLCELAVKTSPNSPVTHYSLAYLYQLENKPGQAIPEYREAIRCNPRWANPRVNLGIILGRMGRLEEAAEQFRRAGDNPEAKHNLEVTERAILRRNTHRPVPAP